MNANNIRLSNQNIQIATNLNNPYTNKAKDENKYESNRSEILSDDLNNQRRSKLRDDT